MKIKNFGILCIILFILNIQSVGAVDIYEPNYSYVNKNISNVDYYYPNYIQKLKDFDLLSPYGGSQTVIEQNNQSLYISTKYLLFQAVVEDIYTLPNESYSISSSFSYINDFAGTTRSYQHTQSIVSYPNGTIRIGFLSLYYDSFRSQYFYVDRSLVDKIEFHIESAMVYVQTNSINYGSSLSKMTVYYRDGTKSAPINYYEDGLNSAGACYIKSYYLRLSIGFDLPNLPLLRNPFKFVRYIYGLVGSLLYFPYETAILEDLSNAEPLSPNFENLPYWTYSTLSLESYNELINFSQTYAYVDRVNQTDYEYGNKTFEFSFNYTKLEAVWSEARYYYNTQTIDPESWGPWVFIMFHGTIIESKLNFNWLRDGLCWIINGIITMGQGILYLLILALNYLLWIPIAYVILIINNYVFYGLTWGLAGIIWVVVWIVLWLWEYALKPIFESIWWDLLWPILGWIWTYVLVPLGGFVIWLIDKIVSAIVWLQNNGWQELIRFYLIILTYILAAILFVLSLGALDFTLTQYTLQIALLTINDFMISFLTVFFDNFLLFLGYGATYVMLVGLVYIKYIYAKAKGYIQRANRLQSMINVYKLPLVLAVRLVQYVIGFIQGGAPTDGLNE